mmetsp:Transcript_46672/g.73064  ORF Transcript_46672/g.73064 Transcript_46672/m.73064 type:complete len:258 (+) Transcript_46672:554-1327(+)
MQSDRADRRQGKGHAQSTESGNNGGVARGRSWAVDNPAKFSAMIVATPPTTPSVMPPPPEYQSTIFGVPTSFPNHQVHTHKAHDFGSQLKREPKRPRKVLKGKRVAPEKVDDEIAISSLLQLWGELNNQDQQDSFNTEDSSESKHPTSVLIAASWAQAGATVVPSPIIGDSQQHIAYGSSALSSALLQHGLSLNCTLSCTPGEATSGSRQGAVTQGKAPEDDLLVLEEQLVDQKLIEGLASAACSPPGTGTPGEWSF